jgi:hypothetical protein
MPGSFNGYEKETADAAQALIHGQYEVRRAGIGALLLYLPFILLSKIFTSPLTSQIIITYTPVFYSALIIPFLYLIARLVTKNTKIAIAFALAIGVGERAELGQINRTKRAFEGDHIHIFFFDHRANHFRDASLRFLVHVDVLHVENSGTADGTMRDFGKNR